MILFSRKTVPGYVRALTMAFYKTVLKRISKLFFLFLFLLKRKKNPSLMPPHQPWRLNKTHPSTGQRVLSKGSEGASNNKAPEMNVHKARDAFMMTAAATCNSSGEKGTFVQPFYLSYHSTGTPEPLLSCRWPWVKGSCPPKPPSSFQELQRPDISGNMGKYM